MNVLSAPKFGALHIKQVYANRLLAEVDNLPVNGKASRDLDNFSFLVKRKNKLRADIELEIGTIISLNQEIPDTVQVSRFTTAGKEIKLGWKALPQLNALAERVHHKGFKRMVSLFLTQELAKKSGIDNILAQQASHLKILSGKKSGGEG